MDGQAEERQQQQERTFRHVMKYTGLFGGVQGITMLVAVVRNKVAAVLLGPAGIALVNIYMTVTNLLNQATNLGISFSAVKHVSELFDQGDTGRTARFVATVRAWSVATAVLGIGATCLLSPLLSLWTFGDWGHALTFCALSPVVGMASVTGGELAILKGLRQLGRVARISVAGALGTLCATAPLYLWLGTDGIVAALLLATAAVTGVHLFYSMRCCPWRMDGCWRAHFRAGLPMVRLGLAFIVAGVGGQGAEFVIRLALLHLGSLADVGFYNSGYVMAVTYASVVFTAIEVDYFPRLSAACADRERMSGIVNQQTEVCVLLVAPFLILFVLAMPFVVHLLYSAEFAPAVPMAVCTVPYMFFKALTLPAAYLSLAHGDSRTYLLTELVYDVFVVAAIPAGFALWGLPGAGWMLSAGGVLDLLVIHLLYRRRYGFRFDFGPLRFYIAQFLLLAAALLAVIALDGRPAMKWAAGGAAFAVSALLSLRRLGREARLAEVLRARLRRGRKGS